jgi:hypothetical protein
MGRVAAVLLLVAGSVTFAAAPTHAGGSADYAASDSSVGGGPDSESAPAVAESRFAGVWDSVTGESHAFVMTLEESPDGGTVSGSESGSSGSRTLHTRA